jgi:hypothetical protein
MFHTYLFFPVYCFFSVIFKEYLLLHFYLSLLATLLKREISFSTTIMHSRLIIFFGLVVIINAQNLTFPDCKSGPLSTFPICDQTLPTRQRAADLISRMTTAEKITQLVHKVPPIPRLSLPEIIW